MRSSETRQASTQTVARNKNKNKNENKTLLSQASHRTSDRKKKKQDKCSQRQVIGKKKPKQGKKPKQDKCSQRQVLGLLIESHRTSDRRKKALLLIEKKKALTGKS